MSQVGKTLLFVLAVGLLIFISLVGASALLSGDHFNFNEATISGDSGWWAAGLTGLGVLSSLAVNILRTQDPRAPVDFKTFFKAMLQPQTFIALCVSPVVFFGALLALKGKELGPAAYLAAFQNGFFWQRILDTKQE